MLARKVFLIAVVTLATAIVIFFLAQEWSFGLTVIAFEDLIRSWGAWGVLASIGLMVVHSFVPFPAEIVAIANGMIYGPVWGTVITWIGAMLGALVAFSLARKLGRPFVESMVSKKNWDNFDDQVGHHSGHLVFIGRFIPIIAFNLINYAAGLTRVSWWTFALATGIGILPLTILMVVMGTHIENFTWVTWLLLTGGGLVLWFVLRHRFKSLLEGTAPKVNIGR